MIRLATENDARALIDIFAPYAVETAVTFATRTPTEAEQKQKIRDVLEQFPWFVLEENGEILGYAYASPHRNLGAYRWCCEISVYVSAKAHRKGVARRLYEKLLEALKRQGYWNVYAGITIPNEASVGFHESFGFVRFATYDRVGFKRGAWHDVGWWRLELQSSSPTEPRDPVPFKTLPH